MNRPARIGIVLLLGAVAGALAGLYIVRYLMAAPELVPASTGPGQASVTMQTVGTIGFGDHPDWVSYLVRTPSGRWVHTTIIKVPAHTLVHVTIYQYDTSTGLRNPLWAQPRGVVGGAIYLNGKPTRVVDAADPAHTFAIPDLGLSVPLDGIPDNAKNQCSAAPCRLSMAHNTITFSFRTGAPGIYRWQCFVPCGAGFLYGNGGPMQTLGYMDGQLVVQ